jgi:indolepyruvate decarboxylase
MSDGYCVGDYLMDRFAELGVDRVFGVPGDYSRCSTTSSPIPR